MNLDKVNLYIANPTQIIPLSDLYVQYLEEQLSQHISLGLNPNDYNLKSEKIQEDLLPILESEYSRVILAKTDKENTIGFGISHIDLYSGYKYGHIDDIMVKKTYRNKGLGFRIYEEIKKWFITQQCESINLTAYSNSKAISFYQKLGFNPVGINFNLKL
ncbi:MAG: GNAT family N-acetyltransferase [bacterium]